ncbi:MAG TPA: hypothetical protein EYH32_10845 [Anaerolineae bacterium]|nr:hypothetical protein [Anaerolineae bacterium]
MTKLKLPDGTPLTLDERRTWWNGAEGEWVARAPDGRLYRQYRAWGNESPRPDRWEAVKFR